MYLHARGDPILSYLQNQEGSHLASLNSTARQDTYEAVNSVVHSVVAASMPRQLALLRVVRQGVWGIMSVSHAMTHCLHAS